MPTNIPKTAVAARLADVRRTIFSFGDDRAIFIWFAVAFLLVFAAFAFLWSDLGSGPASPGNIDPNSQILLGP